MSTHIRLSLVGVLCVMLVSALFIGCGQTGDSPWESYNEAGNDAHEKGNYAEAEKQFLAALREAEKFGPEDPRLAASLNDLALLYYTQGKNAEAEPLYQRALAIWEKVLGPEHPDVAYSLNNLAILYQVQGRYEEAETHFVWALAIREDALGLDHPSVAASLEDYAALLRQIGRSAEATEMDTRAKAIRAKHAKENP